MVGATTGGAGMMAVLNPVPLGQRQSLHSDGQHRTGATSGRGDFRFRTLMHLAEMEAAIAMWWLERSLMRASTAARFCLNDGSVYTP